VDGASLTDADHDFFGLTRTLGGFRRLGRGYGKLKETNANRARRDLINRDRNQIDFRL